MNSAILFSPIGGTDPIPQTNFKDGSMLHICRVYKPDKVYLYMSAEILKNHREDNRYIYCLEKLAQLQGRKMEYHIIQRPDLKNVQLFDLFYNDFRDVIRDIAKEMDDTDRLLLNISSGTPAMKSALLVLSTMGEYPFTSIQVSTPMKMMNQHDHKGFDVELAWEGNEDNREDFENRCEEVHCPALMQIKQEEIIKKLLRIYDYNAAREVAASLPKVAVKNYLPLIELACARLQLDFPRLNILVKETGADCIPIRDGNKQKYFEYALNIDIKRKKGEYTDFIRSITPLIVDVFILILKSECKIDINDYAEGHPLRWVQSKLKSNHELDAFLNEEYKCNGFRYDVVYSDALAKIIGAYTANAKLRELAKNLRDIERNVRNRAAHEIVSLSDNAIKNMTGFAVEEIMKMIKDAFRFTGMGIPQKHWDSYDTMNEAIIAAMP